MRWRRTALLGALAPLGWLAQRWAAAHPDATERFYCKGLFPAVRAVLDATFGWWPVSASVALLAAATVWVAARLVKGVRAWRAGNRSLSNLATRAGAFALAAGGVAWVVFLLLWGFHYGRRPFAWHASLPMRPASVAELGDLLDDLAQRANALRERVGQDEAGLFAPAGGVAGVMARVPAAYEAAAAVHPVLTGRPSVLRDAVLNGLLTSFGITGIYSPFTGESHLNTDVPATQLGFSACHEAAHGLGIAREDEANYVGYVACTLSGEPDLAYSGVLVALAYVGKAMRFVDPSRHRDAMQLLSPAVQRDRKATKEFWQRTKSPAREVAQAINDAYLKVQGQEEGVRSYGRMLDLLLAEQRQRRQRPDGD